MGRVVVGLCVGLVVGVVVSQVLHRLGLDFVRGTPLFVAVAATSVWPWIRHKWDEPFLDWATRWLVTGVGITLLLYWACPSCE